MYFQIRKDIFATTLQNYALPTRKVLKEILITMLSFVHYAKFRSLIQKLFVEGYPKENLFGFFGFFSNLVAGLFSFSGN